MGYHVNGTLLLVRVIHRMMTLRSVTGCWDAVSSVLRAGRFRLDLDAVAVAV